MVRRIINIRVHNLISKSYMMTDVIGHVVEVSHVEMIHVNGKETQKISLELRDLA